MGKAQISFEYLILMGFVTFIISGIMIVALIYTNSAKDSTKINQINDFADKVVSTSEYVYYSGTPSKATIETYLPDEVSLIEINENTLFITYNAYGGTSKIGFPSDVNITGNLSASKGVKVIEILATDDEVIIGNA